PANDGRRISDVRGGSDNLRRICPFVETIGCEFEDDVVGGVECDRDDDSAESEEESTAAAVDAVAANASNESVDEVSCDTIGGGATAKSVPTEPNNELSVDAVTDEVDDDTAALLSGKRGSGG